MKLRLSAVALALLAQTAFCAVPVAFAQDATSQTQPATQDDPSLARQAIEWSQDRLVELDVSISILERDAARFQGEAKAQAQAALKTLRERREAYRARADEAVASARSWTDAEVVEARRSLDESWTAFQTARDEYLEAAQADLATRRAILEAELEARRKAWQTSIDRLKADAAKLAVDQRTALAARIADLNAGFNEAQAEASARIGRLRDASAEAWETTKKGYADAQQLFFDNYAAIRKSIEDATK